MGYEIASIAPAVIDTHTLAGTTEVRPLISVQPTDAATQPVATETKTAKPSRQQLEQAVAELHDRMQQLHTSIQFSIDEDTDKTVVKVIDIEKKQVILQLPPEYMLALAKFFSGDKAGGDKSPRPPSQGLLIRERA